MSRSSARYAAATGDGDGTGPYLRRVVARDFPAPAAVSRDPEHRAHLREYLSDLAAPYRTRVRTHMFDGAYGQSYGEMAEALLRDVLPAGEGVDLLVLAFAIPDIRPGRATATYLSHICPGSPFAFAICDQGAAVGFTGLRLIREYARGGRYPRAVLLILEQSALHYEPAAPAPVPAGNAGVALLTGPDGPVRLSGVRQHTGVEPAAAPALLRADPDAGAPGGRVLLGPGLASIDPAAIDPTAGRAGGRPVDAGQPYTGLWAAFAAELPAAADAPEPVPGRITLAEYDSALRYLCLSTVEITGATEPRGGTRNAAIASPVELGAA